MSTDNSIRLRRPSFLFYALLGSIFSAFALVSLTQKAFDIGLVPVMQDILDFYRGLVHPIMDWLLGWVRFFFPHWNIPEELKDWYALSFIGAAAMTRGILWTNEDAPLRWKIFQVGWGMFFSLTGVGLLAFLLAISTKGARDEWKDAYRNIRIAVFLALAETAAFFAINSQM